MADGGPKDPAAPEQEAQGPQVPVEADDPRNVYANVCDVVCGREEAVLSFGLSQAHEQGASTIEAKLTSRLIVSPLAAKRLARLLKRFIAEYERRYGGLEARK